MSQGLCGDAHCVVGEAPSLCAHGGAELTLRGGCTPRVSSHSRAWFHNPSDSHMGFEPIFFATGEAEPCSGARAAPLPSAMCVIAGVSLFWPKPCPEDGSCGFVLGE